MENTKVTALKKMISAANKKLAGAEKKVNVVLGGSASVIDASDAYSSLADVQAGVAVLDLMASELIKTGETETLALMHDILDLCNKVKHLNTMFGEATNGTMWNAVLSNMDPRYDEDEEEIEEYPEPETAGDEDNEEDDTYLEPFIQEFEAIKKHGDRLMEEATSGLKFDELIPNATLFHRNYLRLHVLMGRCLAFFDSKEDVPDDVADFVSDVMTYASFMLQGLRQINTAIFVCEDTADLHAVISDSTDAILMQNNHHNLHLCGANDDGELDDAYTLTPGWECHCSHCNEPDTTPEAEEEPDKAEPTVRIKVGAGDDEIPDEVKAELESNLEVLAKALGADFVSLELS